MIKVIYERVIRRLIKFKGNCCDSCHDDMDNGFFATELYHEDLGYTKKGEERYSEVCCTVKRAFDKWLKESRRNIRRKDGRV